MKQPGSQGIQPWMLFALPAAIVVPIIAGILLGGPVLGFLVAGLVAVVVVGAAIAMPPRGATTGREPAPPAGAEDRGWRRAAALRFLVPLVIAAAGIVLIAAGDRTVSAIGWGVFGVAITVAISLIFLEIGYSEDRDRSREQRAREAPRARRRDR